MSEIIPAILPKSLEDLEEKTALLVGKVPIVHIDAVDGTLTRDAGWPYASVEDNFSLPHKDEINFEVHLMVREPEHLYEKWVRAGVEGIIIHVESFYTEAKLAKFLRDVRSRSDAGSSFLGVEVGLAINLDTALERVAPHVRSIDFLHLMSIDDLGTQGDKFEPRIFGRIRECKAAFPETVLSVDGGISIENADDLIALGVDRLVVGSAIWRAEDPEAALRDFLELASGA